MLNMVSGSQGFISGTPVLGENFCIAVWGSGIATGHHAIMTAHKLGPENLSPVLQE